MPRLGRFQFSVTSLVGMFALASGLEGFIKRKLAIWERVLAVAAGLLMIHPGLRTDLVGILVIGFILLDQYAGKRNKEEPVVA